MRLHVFPFYSPSKLPTRFKNGAMNSPHMDHDYVGLVGFLPLICAETMHQSKHIFHKVIAIFPKNLCNHMVFSNVGAFLTEICSTKTIGRVTQECVIP